MGALSRSDGAARAVPVRRAAAAREEDITGVHLRTLPPPALPAPVRAVREEALGCELLVFRSPFEPPRRIRLGSRPALLLAVLASAWMGLALIGGAALRFGVQDGPAPMGLHWERAHARMSAALPLPSWSRLPSARPVDPNAFDAAGRRARRLGLGSRRVASELLRGKVDPSWSAEVASLGRRPSQLLWPVARGWFVRGYGSGEDGYHLAVDVAAEEGSTVRAAADGLVAYADDGVRGYGNLLLLVHAGDFVTMYAHNRTHEVAVGEFVRAGEPIATVGNTGISRGPHVHFEFMHDRENCDPVPLFAPGVRHRDSGFVLGRSVTWDGRKPRAVHCERRRRHPRSRWGDHDDS